MQRARLILICGLPGSGKTTLAKRLAREVRAVRLSPDEWKHALCIDYYDEEARVRLEDQLWRLAQELLTLGQSVIMENGFWARAERDELRLAGRSLGATVELHYLEARVEELWRRLELRNAKVTPGVVPIGRSDLERWAAQFEAPDAVEFALFDERHQKEPMVEARTVTAERVRLEALRLDHAEQMVQVLADPSLYAVIGGRPPSLSELRARYRRQLAGPKTGESWLNWIVLVDDRPIGYVQATVTTGPAGATADLAWLIGVSAQGHGFATEAATTAVAQLQEQGVTAFTAHIASGHAPSERVAQRLGLRPTGVEERGEQVWTLSPG